MCNVSFITNQNPLTQNGRGRPGLRHRLTRLSAPSMMLMEFISVRISCCRFDLTRTQNEKSLSRTVMSCFPDTRSRTAANLQQQITRFQHKFSFVCNDWTPICDHAFVGPQLPGAFAQHILCWQESFSLPMLLLPAFQYDTQARNCSSYIVADFRGSNSHLCSITVRPSQSLITFAIL